MKKTVIILCGATATVCLVLLLFWVWNKKTANFGATLHKNAVRASNLRVIEGAKEEWAIERGRTTNDTPSWEDLRPYMLPEFENRLPYHPNGDVYTIGRVGELPICSFSGGTYSFDNTDTNSAYYGIPVTKPK